jgi:serpin B
VIKDMGIRKVFRDLTAIVRIRPSFLTQVAQRADIRVDWSGIYAEAETITGGVIGGIGDTKQEPFRMKIDRPFLFLVRDNATDTLLFIGAVMDPTRR